MKYSTSILVQTQKTNFFAKFYTSLLLFAFFSFLIQQMLKMSISTSGVCSTQTLVKIYNKCQSTNITSMVQTSNLRWQSKRRFERGFAERKSVTNTSAHERDRGRYDENVCQKNCLKSNFTFIMTPISSWESNRKNEKKNRNFYFQSASICNKG